MTVLRSNLTKGSKVIYRGLWGVLGREVVGVRFSGLFYCTVVQALLIYGLC